MKKLVLVTLSLLTLTSVASANDALWGALIGGVIGNQVGSSDHNQYIGAAIGAVLAGGNDYSNRTYNNRTYQRSYYNEGSHYRQTGGYYTYVTRRVYVEPVYGYTQCGDRVVVRNGYYKTVREKVWVP